MIVVVQEGWRLKQWLWKGGIECIWIGEGVGCVEWCQPSWQKLWIIADVWWTIIGGNVCLPTNQCKEGRGPQSKRSVGGGREVTWGWWHQGWCKKRHVGTTTDLVWVTSMNACRDHSYIALVDRENNIIFSRMPMWAALKCRIRVEDAIVWYTIWKLHLT